MSGRSVRPVILFLLLLVVVMQPVMVFGDLLGDTPESHAATDGMELMGCCNDNSFLLSSLSNAGMECGEMTPTDCALIASLGGCGNAVSALSIAAAGLPAEMKTDLGPSHPTAGYLSIILDTLTPPPNASKA